MHLPYIYASRNTQVSNHVLLHASYFFKESSFFVPARVVTMRMTYSHLFAVDEPGELGGRFALVRGAVDLDPVADLVAGLSASDDGAILRVYCRHRRRHKLRHRAGMEEAQTETPSWDGGRPGNTAGTGGRIAEALSWDGERHKLRHRAGMEGGETYR